MRKDQTICLNSKVDGKQPSVADRIYYGGGLGPAITTGWLNWVLYEEDNDCDTDKGTERGGETKKASLRR